LPLAGLVVGVDPPPLAAEPPPDGAAEVPPAAAAAPATAAAAAVPGLAVVDPPVPGLVVAVTPPAGFVVAVPATAGFVVDGAPAPVVAVVAVVLLAAGELGFVVAVALDPLEHPESAMAATAQVPRRPQAPADDPLSDPSDRRRYPIAIPPLVLVDLTRRRTLVLVANGSNGRPCARWTRRSSWEFATRGRSRRTSSRDPPRKGGRRTGTASGAPRVLDGRRSTVRPRRVAGAAAEDPPVPRYPGTADHEDRLLDCSTAGARLGHRVVDHHCSFGSSARYHGRSGMRRASTGSPPARHHEGASPTAGTPQPGAGDAATSRSGNAGWGR